MEVKKDVLALEDEALKLVNGGVGSSDSEARDPEKKRDDRDPSATREDKKERKDPHRDDRGDKKNPPDPFHDILKDKSK